LGARETATATKLEEEIMAKAYLVLCYHSVSDEKALQEYAKLALPAIQGAGGRYLARGAD
jgi:uncharacterized protein (DUF1330 family)